MGLITGLVTWPLAPVRGVVWVAGQILDEAERQWSDPSVVQAALRDVEERHSAGLLTDSEAAELEDELVRRLINRATEGGDG